MKKKYTIKDFKENVKWYRKHIESDEFNKYLEERIKMNNRYLKEETDYENKPDLIGKNIKCTSVSFYDVFTNEDFAKLVKKEHALDTKRFKADKRYKASNIIKNYNYINLEYGYRSISSFSDIRFINDDYISNLRIHWTQINNYYAFFEFKFFLKVNIQDNTIYKKFIKDRIDIISNKDFYFVYDIEDFDSVSSFDRIKLGHMHDGYLSLILQHYITSELHSNYGRNNALTKLYFMFSNKDLDINSFNTKYYGNIYYNVSENYIAIYDNDFSRDNHIVYFNNTKSTNFDLVRIISEYGNDIYYFLFGQIEKSYFRNKFSKYISGSVCIIKTIFFKKDIMYLTKKIHSIDDKTYGKNDNLIQEFNECWKYYNHGNEVEVIYNYLEFKDMYIAMYKSVYDYYKTVIDLSNIRITLLIAIIAVAIAVVSLF
ncbi:hypothetical protein ACAG96_04475 [Candidatus Izemoplasma sp. B36]|uniref:hypothetical protein n=1 Tax=Candidatus Izemoplasma sp. B36 TaxID=3242468 RepID=UPI003556D454